MWAMKTPLTVQNTKTYKDIHVTFKLRQVNGLNVQFVRLADEGSVTKHMYRLTIG